jgi:hypothetical protein
VCAGVALGALADQRPSGMIAQAGLWALATIPAELRCELRRPKVQVRLPMEQVLHANKEDRSEENSQEK